MNNKKQRETSREIVSKQNKQIILRYHDLVFNQHQTREAATQFLAPEFFTHNANTKQKEGVSGVATFIENFEHFFQQCPDFRVEIKKIVADGDFVVLYVHAKNSKFDLGTAVVDMYQMKNGRISEHWDVIRPINGNELNPHAFF